MGEGDSADLALLVEAVDSRTFALLLILALLAELVTHAKFACELVCGFWWHVLRGVVLFAVLGTVLAAPALLLLLGEVSLVATGIFPRRVILTAWAIDWLIEVSHSWTSRPSLLSTLLSPLLTLSSLLTRMEEFTSSLCKSVAIIAVAAHLWLSWLHWLLLS